MVNTETRTIDGFEVAVTQLPCMKSIRMLTRLGKLFGPALTKALAGLDAKDLKSLTSADLTVIGAGFAELFITLTEDEVEKLARDLLAAATIDNAPLLSVMNVKLTGMPLTFLKILLFALEINYRSFFDALPAIGSLTRTSAGEAEKPPSPTV